MKPDLLGLVRDADVHDRDARVAAADVAATAGSRTVR
jgi:hypothetical protein